MQINPNAASDIVQVALMFIVMLGSVAAIFYLWERRRKTRHTH